MRALLEARCERCHTWAIIWWLYAIDGHGAVIKAICWACGVKERAATTARNTTKESHDV